MLKNNNCIYGDISQLATAILRLVKCKKIIRSEPIVWHERCYTFKSDGDCKKVVTLSVTSCVKTCCRESLNADTWCEDNRVLYLKYRNRWRVMWPSLSVDLNSMARTQQGSSCRGRIRMQRDIGLLYHEVWNVARYRDTGNENKGFYDSKVESTET